MTPSELLSNLHQFSGTEGYYKLTPKILLTDGTKYLADQAGAYWLMDAIGSYLVGFKGNECFISATLAVKNDRSGLVLDNGNGVVLAMQSIGYTDFPLMEIKLYAVWDSEYWVILLPGEY